MSNRFGRNKPLPDRPPEVPRQVQMDDTLRAIREKEMLRLTDAWLVGPSLALFLIFCATWAAVVCGIVLLFWK